ncbi:MAG: hypothetical protein JWM80_5783 [Cyanobacteria bacterium RYN_339]|nr:hypothetical protein [Cyanobacteria bacterium RYN_339]
MANYNVAGYYPTVDYGSFDYAARSLVDVMDKDRNHSLDRTELPLASYDTLDRNHDGVTAYEIQIALQALYDEPTFMGLNVRDAVDTNMRRFVSEVSGMRLIGKLGAGLGVLAGVATAYFAEAAAWGLLPAIPLIALGAFVYASQDSKEARGRALVAGYTDALLAKRPVPLPDLDHLGTPLGHAVELGLAGVVGAIAFPFVKVGELVGGLLQRWFFFLPR